MSTGRSPFPSLHHPSGYYSGHKESNNLHRDIVVVRVLRGAELTSQSAFERNIQPAWQSLKLLTRRYLNSGQGNNFLASLLLKYFKRPIKSRAFWAKAHSSSTCFEGRTPPKQTPLSSSWASQGTFPAFVHGLKACSFLRRRIKYKWLQESRLC